jgi:hypothetical protein
VNDLGGKSATLRSTIGRATLCLVCLAAKCGGSFESSSSNTSPANGVLVGQSDTVYHLDFDHRGLSQILDAAGAAAGRYKFVEIEVAHVTNPQMRALVFEVSYRPPGAAPVHLGGFTLYPANNPGKFVVPLSSIHVEEQGAFLVSLSSPDVWTKGDSVKVAINSLRLRRS